MQQYNPHYTFARKALDNLLHIAETYPEWVPEHGLGLLYDTGLNRHLNYTPYT
jgi:hypothetical protein